MIRKIIKKTISNTTTIRRFDNYQIVFNAREHLNLFFGRNYEPKLWNNISQYIDLDDDDEIIDIGANIGQAALKLHRYFPNCKIFSYEPQFKEFEFLRFNYFINNIKGCAINKGVSVDGKPVSLSIDNETGGRTTFFDLQSDENMVDTVGLQSLINERTRLIKVDIEGYEEVLFNEYHHNFDNCNFIIEVREDTSLKVLRVFWDSHDIFIVEKGIQLSKLEPLSFCNIVCVPKKR